MIHALSPKIERGELQVFCVDSVDRSSWYNSWAHPADKLHRQNAFDAYLVIEFAPHRTKPHGELAADGRYRLAAAGYHAMNFALRHPDLVAYVVSMSGAFDIPKRFLNGYYDQNAYFNSPLDSLPQLGDGWFLDTYRHNYYVLATGNGDYFSIKALSWRTNLGPSKFRTFSMFGKDLATIGRGGSKWPKSSLRNPAQTHILNGEIGKWQ